MNVITDCSIIWLGDKDIDDEIFADNLQYNVVYSLHTFMELGSCSSFILHCTSGTRLLLIVVKDRYVDQLLQKVLIYLPSETTAFIYVLTDKWLFHWKKDTRIRGSFHPSEENRIIEILQGDLKSHLIERWSCCYCLFNQDARQITIDQLNNENAKFMWFQLFIQVLLRMPSTPQSKNDLLEQSFLAYTNNKAMRDAIIKFDRTYQAKDAIEWYTKSGFLFRLFNQACRTDDIDLLFKFRFFIRDLYNEVKKRYYEQCLQRNSEEVIIVYRGTTMSNGELNMLCTPSTEKKIIWLNTFISTSLRKDVAETFVCGFDIPNQVGVLQEIHIKRNIEMSSTPFIFITQSNVAGGEKEVLLSIGSVFELESIEENHRNIWEMKLQMINYEDCIRNDLRIWLEDDIEQETSMITFSNFLAYRGDFQKAEKYNKILLKELGPHDLDRPLVHNNLGYAYQKMGTYTNALYHLNTSIDLYLKMSASNHIANFTRKLACAYNNKGLVHRSLGEFDDALKYINKSLEMRHDDPSLPEKQQKHLAIERSYCHENLGLLYKDQCKYEPALHHLQETLNIRKKYLPANHYMIAQVYNNLGTVYNRVGNHLKSIECIEHALNCQNQSLPHNHPHRGTMYNTLGEAYYNQRQYSMALLNFKKAIDIYQDTQTVNPLLEAIALSNMGSVMNIQKDYDGALKAFLHALTIIEREKPHHSDVARCLSNIGSAYAGKDDSATAIIYFQKTLEFCQLYLDENNEVTAITCFRLAKVLAENQFDLAIEYYKRAISIYTDIGLPHHQDAITCQVDLGYLYSKNNNHQFSLQCYEQVIVHCKKAQISEWHPLWILVYTRIGIEHYLMGQYERALVEYEHALKHINGESVETARIYKEMNNCREKIIETDVHATIVAMLNQLNR